MPRSETIISVFVASPSDVAEERQILNDVITDLNTVWSRSLGVRFDLMGWEKNVRPGLGGYPQDVINSQIPEDYDICIAIFWGRIGTPTPQYESGTTEELYKAIERHKNGSPEIMVYFKDAPLAPSKIDPEQLTKLNRLKSTLSNAGCLLRTFGDAAEFESTVRSNLSAIAQRFSTNANTISKIHAANSDTNNPVEEKTALTSDTSIDEQYGLLDYIDLYESKIASFTVALVSTGEATQLVGEQMRKRTDQINRIIEAEGSVDRSRMRKIIDLSCDDIDQYVHTLSTQIEIIRESRIASFDAMSRAISLQLEMQTSSERTDELDELDRVICQMIESAEAALRSLLSYRGIMAAMPRMSVRLNRTKNKAVIALDAMADELINTISSAKSVLAVINEV